jgi:hypothetical protein
MIYRSPEPRAKYSATIELQLLYFLLFEKIDYVQRLRGERPKAATGSAERARHSRSVAEAIRSAAERVSNSQLAASGLGKLASHLEGLASRFKI